MQPYRHRQKASAILWILGTVVVVIGFVASRSGEGRFIMVLVAAILVVTIVVFSSLTVEVTSTHVTLFFGPGFIRKSFPVTEIREVRSVTNPWYYGWGIHMTPHGWLFNVAGFEAVELGFDSGRKVRIGTDEPHRLQEALHRAMAGA